MYLYMWLGTFSADWQQLMSLNQQDIRSRLKVAEVIHLTGGAYLTHSDSSLAPSSDDRGGEACSLYSDAGARQVA